MDVSKRYEAQKIEKKIYDYWLKGNYFRSLPNDKKPYTLIMPPPNVTGVLHLGHMLNASLLDVLIRRARMQGYNACWVPGTDHASIATEAKVRKALEEEGLSKEKVSKELFLDRAWQWCIRHKDIIIDQFKKLGCSCDWERNTFTMDPSHCQVVIESFIKLYEKGMIYRAKRMVNWDPEAKTSISDEEIIYEEKQANLYFIRYKIENEPHFITVATTRPETIFGDSAICIHPEDGRYNLIKSKKAIIPILNKAIPIIEDAYVEMDFGSGALKITPAHDFNDDALAKKHQLEYIEILNEDATLNEKALHYKGKDRFKARALIVKELEEIGALEKIEKHHQRIGLSERTFCVIEPRLSLEWFVKIEDLATKAFNYVKEKEILFYPEKLKNTYFSWLKNINDWNISRQLYWGHPIPVYYYGKKDGDFVVAKNIDQALILARKKSSNPLLDLKDLRQETSVLDTWFSSWLWPISLFNGFDKKATEELAYYYPIEVLVTGPDIIFFWVARMIMAGAEFTQNKPFKQVYFTGIVRDKEGKKMSKSLGNSPDVLTLIDTYGADSIRMGLMIYAHQGNDLLYDEKLCIMGRNFTNKIWNVFRLIKSWEGSLSLDDQKEDKASSLAIEWFEHKLNEAIEAIDLLFESYRLSEALMKIYKLFWDDFCAYYLEILKTNSLSKASFSKSVSFFETLLKLIHPFMPFISEEIWQSIKERTSEQALLMSPWPEKKPYDIDFIKKFSHSLTIVSEVRNLSVSSIKEEPPVLYGLRKDDFFKEIVLRLSKVASFFIVDELPSHLEGVSFLIEAKAYFIAMKTKVDHAKEIEKIKEEITYQEGFLMGIKKKLSNKKFMDSAPEHVIKNEEKKQKDTLDRLELLYHQLKNMKDQSN